MDGLGWQEITILLVILVEFVIGIGVLTGA